MSYTSEEIASMLHTALKSFKGIWHNTRLVFKRRQIYTVNLVNHRGEVVASSYEQYEEPLEIEVLCDGDLYRAMSDPSITMKEFFDKIKDKVATHLFDISLTQTITSLEWDVVDNRANISIYFDDSIDGQTNIDADVIDAILAVIDTKYGCWNEVLERMNNTRWRIF